MSLAAAFVGVLPLRQLVAQLARISDIHVVDPKIELIPVNVLRRQRVIAAGGVVATIEHQQAIGALASHKVVAHDCQVVVRSARHVGADDWAARHMRQLQRRCINPEPPADSEMLVNVQDSPPAMMGACMLCNAGMYAEDLAASNKVEHHV